MEMLATIRAEEESGKQVLFVVHSNASEDVVVYLPSSNDAEVVSCYKLQDFTNRDSMIELTSYERMMAYGSKLVPNHERDYPHVRELTLPAFMSTSTSHEDGASKRSVGALEAAAMASPAPSSSSSTFATPLHGTSPFGMHHSEHEEVTGQLIGAIELPLTPDIIVDVWRAPDGQCWSTTSVDGVSFAVLERIYIQRETHWGVSQIVQVDLFGRHPAKGFLLNESVTQER